MSDQFLLRDTAPFSKKVWDQIDQTVVAAARGQLSARRFIQIQGPFGLDLKVLSAGDKPIDKSQTGPVSLAAGPLIPLMMIQAEFAIPVRDVAAFERSGLPLDLAAAANAAILCARQEDDLIFNGCPALGLKGLLNAGKSHSLKLKPWTSPGDAADDLIKAITTLDKDGFHGPYALALAPDLYNQLFRRYPQSPTTELEHLRQIVTDGVVKSHAIAAGGVLISGPDLFAAVVLGQDLAAGFVGPQSANLLLNLVESVALKLTEPNAVCVLKS